RLRLAALGDRPGDVLEGVFTGAGEGEDDVRFAGGAVFLLRVGDVVARERRFVFQREPARLSRFVDFSFFVGRQFRDDDGAGGNFDDEAVFRQVFAGRAEVEGFFAGLGAR